MSSKMEHETKAIIYTHDSALDCPFCGGELEVTTTLSYRQISKGFYQDGDSAVCTEKDCDLKNGQVSCDPETKPYINGDW